MNKNFPVIFSAILYAISIPLSKIMTAYVSPVMLGAFTYLGAGLGLFIYNIFSYLQKKEIKDPLTKKELPYTLGMVVLDVLAISLLMYGLTKTNSANASLLSNFEIAATSLIALIFFKEYISKKLWIGIILIILASIILTFEGLQSFDFTLGSIFVIAAYLCWGMENNCTKMISSKNTQEITIIKGIFSGTGSLALAYFAGESLPQITPLLTVMLIGFVSYGLSVAIYIYSQRFLGAAKTAAYFATAPFFGVLFSLVILGERPSLQFYVALIIMIFASVIIFKSATSGKNI